MERCLETAPPARRVPRIHPRKTPKGIEIGPVHSHFGRRMFLPNPEEQASFDGRRFVFSVGNYGVVSLLVYGRDASRALDVVIDWCADHAPGILCDDDVTIGHAEALEAGKTSEEAWIEATEGTFMSGSHYLAARDVRVVAENPTRQQLDEILFPRGADWTERTRCTDIHFGGRVSTCIVLEQEYRRAG